MKKGWQKKTLGEVCSLLNRGISPMYLESGGVCVLNQKCIRDHEVSYEPSRRHDSKAKKVAEERFVKLGDVLVNSTGTGTLGRVAQVREEPEEATTVDSHVTIVRPKPGLFHLDFFGYMLVIIEDAIKEAGEGCGGQTELARSVLAERFGVSYPESLAEQQRIVGLLDEAFEGLATAKANAEKNLQNARALFESALTTAMSGKLTKEWRKSHPHVETASTLLDQILTKRRRAWSKKGEYPEPTPPATNHSQSIPASWTWTNLSQLKTFSLYGPRFSNDDYSQTGVLVLRTSDIDEHGKVNSDTAPKLKMTEEEFDKYRCKKGDILITRTGSLGTLAVFDDDTRAIPGAYLIQFRLGFSEVIPWFLFAFFKTPAAQARLTSGGTGAGIQNLNVPTLEAIPIPFPPLDEQREIVSQLNTLSEETQRLARLYERKHAALEALKKSLLHQAFTGEL